MSTSLLRSAIVVSWTTGHIDNPLLCRPFAEKYEQDQDAFFKDYTAAHIKLSELGVEWQGQPFTLEPEDQTPQVEEKLEDLQVSKE